MGAGDFASAVEAEAAADPVKKESTVASPPIASSRAAAEPQISQEMKEIWDQMEAMVLRR